MDAASLIAPLLTLARHAGEAILTEKRRGFSVITKPDGSPQTSADRLAEAILISGVRLLTPTIPILAEESADGAAPYDPAQPFWLIDPLDGTKSFVAGHDDFSINIGLIIAGRPLIGIIYAPERQELFWNDAPNRAWYQPADGSAQPLQTRQPPAAGLTMITGRRTHTGARLQRWLEEEKVTDHLMLSSALKYGYIALGRADIYPRLGTTMEWDNAAGEAILHAAGGLVLTPDGLPLPYGQSHLKHHGLVARGHHPPMA